MVALRFIPAIPSPLRLFHASPHSTLFPPTSLQQLRTHTIDQQRMSTQPHTNEEHRRSSLAALQTPLWKSLFESLARKIRPIPIDGNCVRILHSPGEFYETILSLSRSAKKRISISALYLGTGDLEQKMIETIVEALKQNDQLSVSVVMDCLRGTRVHQESSTAMLLTPLVKEFPTQSCVSFFHTPLLTGFWKDVLPARVNELAGVQHVKGAVFDNTVILTGANLGDQYFVNRQDRYFVIESELLANHFSSLFEGMSKVSYKLCADGELSWPDGVPNLQDDLESYLQYSKECLLSHFFRYQDDPSNLRNDADTWIFPTLQMGPCDIRIDEDITRSLLCPPTNGL
eukprot:TRINITY_DN1374_c0_g1_i2.p1 TRINITY_DN1374_c0_g1~~TRINITY_DN1374_c0_g1_i2.p1  ORF type:complete len:344 (-),score=59.70 TRINITY_DN1374_c0_g1_i2:1138-2169(-)